MGDRDVAFTVEAWRVRGVPPNQTYDHRMGMVGSLLREYGLIGMRRAQVLALLGEPDAAEWSSVLRFPAWFLGRGNNKSFGLKDSDIHGLVVEFDAEGIARAVHEL